jgi:propanol-preferring alcohol dehydrogenase
LVHTGVTPAQAAVTTDAVITAYHAVKTTGNVKPTETVFIFGLGGLGFNALQIVLAIGARVIVTDKREEVLAEAIKFGVPKEDVVPIGKNAVEFVQERGLVVDIVIDFVGVNETFTASQELGKQIQHWLPCFGIGLLTRCTVRPAGRLVQVGLLGAELTINNILCMRKKLSILCSYGGKMEDLEDGLDLVHKGVLKPQVETGDLDDFPEVLERLHHGMIKSRIALIPKHD